jgi:hypothetical protein
MHIDFLRAKFLSRFGGLKASQEELDRMFRQFLWEEEEMERMRMILEAEGSKAVSASSSPAGGLSSSSPSGPALALEFSDLLNAPVVDPYSVSDWNTFFDLPSYGSEFTDVVVSGNTVSLYGGGAISIKASLFDSASGSGDALVGVNDEASSITSIEAGAFGNVGNNGCPNLVSVSFPVITAVPDNCFKGCSSLTELSLPLVTTIGDNSFEACLALASVNLSAVTTIGEYAFYDCTALDSITFASATSLGDSCFRGSGISSVTSANLPLVTSLPAFAFALCSNLTEADLPGVTSIGNNCFNFCSSMVSLALNDLLTAGYYAFQNCGSLGRIDLPSATSIGGYCFAGCTSLDIVNLPNCLPLGPTIGNDRVFDGITFRSIDLTVQSLLATINSGGPDGDIVDLLDNNPSSTVNYV